MNIDNTEMTRIQTFCNNVIAQVAANVAAANGTVGFQIVDCLMTGSFAAEQEDQFSDYDIIFVTDKNHIYEVTSGNRQTVLRAINSAMRPVTYSLNRWPNNVIRWWPYIYRSPYPGLPTAIGIFDGTVYNELQDIVDRFNV